MQTLYLAWGSKRELLRAHLEAALAGQPTTPYAHELPHLISHAVVDAGDDPRAIVEHIVHLYKQVAEHAALGWQLYRDASATDSQVAQDWPVLQQLRRQTFSDTIGRLPENCLRLADRPEDTASMSGLFGALSVAGVVLGQQFLRAARERDVPVEFGSVRVLGVQPPHVAPAGTRSGRSLPEE